MEKKLSSNTRNFKNLSNTLMEGCMRSRRVELEEDFASEFEREIERSQLLPFSSSTDFFSKNKNP